MQEGWRTAAGSARRSRGAIPKGAADAAVSWPMLLINLLSWATQENRFQVTAIYCIQIVLTRPCLSHDWADQFCDNCWCFWTAKACDQCNGCNAECSCGPRRCGWCSLSWLFAHEGGHHGCHPGLPPYHSCLVRQVHQYPVVITVYWILLGVHSCVGALA